MNDDLPILALESSGKSGSLAAALGGKLLAEVELDRSLRTARTLAPGMVDLLAQVGWKPADVKLLAVTIGPGSFTGLRIGVTTAKMFAYAVGAQVLGISTLEVIAAQVPAVEGTRIETLLDAQRGEVFVSVYRRDAAGVSCVEDLKILSQDAWLAGLKSPTTVAGPVLDKLAKPLPPGVTQAKREVWHPRASTVARLAFLKYDAGQRDDLFTLLPKYYRKSYAEEKRERTTPPRRA